MRVYSRFVKENGARMVGAQVGLGGDATAWTLELKGDKNFPGPKGRAELDRQRAALRDRLRTTRPTRAPWPRRRSGSSTSSRRGARRSRTHAATRTCPTACGTSSSS